jgi:hypothetical protein
MQQATNVNRSGLPNMTATDAEAWARLRLVQGRSSAELWELISAGGHTLLTVGSAPGSSWVVHEAGVAPVSFSLHWDGATLRAADTHRAGNVRIDGVPLGPDWRVLAGRVRIDFGQAAIVAETSGPATRTVTHPLDAALPVSQRPNPALGSSPSPKATLLGVSPLTRGAAAAPIQASVPAHASAPASVAHPPLSGAPGKGPEDGSFRPSRPSDRARPHKATLMGMTPLPPASSGSSAPAPATSVASGVRPQAVADSPFAGKTLAGVGMDGLPLSPPASARPSAPARRIGGASLADDGQRTLHGFPAMNPAAQAFSVPPPAQPTQPPDDVPRDAQADDMPHAAAQGPEAVPQAVLIGGEHGHPYAGRAERLSDAPTEMRDLSSLEARRRSFPWRYVGMGILTAVAYVAWLYLLDHI